MTRRRFQHLAAAALVLLVFPGTARSATITGVNDDFNIGWSFACGGAGTCTGNAAFDVLSFSSTQVELRITTNNTLNAPGEYLVGLGFDMSPTTTGITSFTPGTYFDTARLNTTFPGFQTLDVCLADNNQGSCGAGMAKNGQPSMTTDTFTIKLAGNYGSSVTLSNFGLKYAGAFSSFNGPGTPIDGGGGGNPGPVPEPASLILLGTGLAIAARRRKKLTQG